MSLPDFDDFLGSLDPDELARELSKASELRVIEYDAASTEKMIESVWAQAVDSSVRFTLAYLRLYHEWLRANLQPDE